MTPREKKLIWGLGIVGGLAVVLGAWMLVISPWLDASAASAVKAREATEKETRALELAAKLPKLAALKARSLPGDLSVATREYESLLGNLLNASGVSFSLKPNPPGDLKNVPVVGPKLPAYSRIGFKIILRKIDLPTLTRFLESYYRQPILHQIVRFDLKRVASESEKRETRADLEAEIITEALVIDGAEKRLTLFPIGQVHGALTGSLGMAMITDNQKLAGLLASGRAPKTLAPGRDYALLPQRDPFHGPIPAKVEKYVKPDEPKVVKEPEPAKPTVPLEDISQYIRLNLLIPRPDGTARADILDISSNHEYEITRKFNLDGKLEVRVKKYFILNGARKPLDNFDDLVISEDGTATDRKFKVVDFLPNALLLSETPQPPKEEPPTAEEMKEPVKAIVKGGKGSPVKKPATGLKGPQLAAALLGGGVLVPAKLAEKRYLWTLGDTLKEIQEVKTGEPEKPKEASPMPRDGR